MTNRRMMIQGASAAVIGLTLPSAKAAKWPEQPITIVDLSAAGGNTDYFARLLADRLAPILGTSVVVDNKPGAGGVLAATHVHRAKPDGYTLGIAAVSTLCAAPAVNPAAVKYDPIKGFSYISKLVTLPSLLVTNNKLPVRSFEDLLALAKAQPGRLTCGVPGIGSAGHVLMEYFMKLAGVKLLIVPYKAGGAMLTDLISGQLDILSNNIPELLPHVKSGSIRALAVRDNRRLAALPDIPTYKELGLPEVSAPLWFGLVGPAGIPAPILDQLRAATHKAVVDRGFLDKTLAVSASISPSSGPDFQREAEAMYHRLQQVVRDVGIKPD
jgi:tripartite-type tricarboxylate transporter receptor subunit TctC